MGVFPMGAVIGYKIATRAISAMPSKKPKIAFFFS
jgi:hypothetical protein